MVGNGWLLNSSQHLYPERWSTLRNHESSPDPQTNGRVSIIIFFMDLDSNRASSPRNTLISCPSVTTWSNKTSLKPRASMTDPTLTLSIVRWRCHSFAYFSKQIQKNYTYILIVLALLTGISRLYLGVHFISDVIAGLFIGAIVGWFIYKLETKF